MIKASIATALAGLALLGLRLSGAVPFSVLLPLSLLALGVALYLAKSLPRFLQIFVGVLALVEVILAVLLMADALGMVTGALTGYVPPASMPVGATIFAFVILG